MMEEPSSLASGHWSLARACFVQGQNYLILFRAHSYLDLGCDPPTYSDSAHHSSVALSGYHSSMFANYQDLEAYYTEGTNTAMSGDSHMDLGSCPIPSEYLPTYVPPDPWYLSTSCQQDFILIAEFSEQEGPKPLVTILPNVSNKLKWRNVFWFHYQGCQTFQKE